MNEGETYKERMKKALFVSIVVSVGIGFVATITEDIIWGSIIALFIFIVQYLKFDLWNRTFILNISFDQSITSIDYLDRDKKKNISGATSEFILKKEFATAKTRKPYLSIYQNQKFRIKQPELGEWTENKMDEIILSFPKS